MKFILATIALAITAPAYAECNCYPPDYINVRNGDLVPMKPIKAYAADYRAYRWTGWPDYREKLRKICARRGNTCTADTWEFINRRIDANGNPQ